MSSAARTYCTPEQYFAFERKSPIKHEYEDGSIIAMAGTSRRHSLIVGNLFFAIRSQLGDRPCEVHMNDLRVCVSRTGRYTYPDLVAVCGEPQLLDEELDTLLNPSLIVEVLSPSTAANDRGPKFARYRRMDSLKEYVLIDQDRVCVERFTRQGDEWLMTELSRLDEDVLRLSSIACDVPLREIHAKVAFPNPAPAPAAPHGL
jgi:Uma2 family endonuclease